jgi:hypothetical protein
MKVGVIADKILKAMHKRPEQYVRIDRYQETYMDSYDEPLYELDIAAGYKSPFGEKDEVVQKMISITMDDMKKLIIVAAVKLDDLLDDFNSVTEIKI